ncbi:unnamed protein product, partial [Rotaria magnacalcarata]
MLRQRRRQLRDHRRQQVTV